MYVYVRPPTHLPSSRANALEVYASAYIIYAFDFTRIHLRAFPHLHCGINGDKLSVRITRKSFLLLFIFLLQKLTDVSFNRSLLVGISDLKETKCFLSLDETSSFFSCVSCFFFFSSFSSFSSFFACFFSFFHLHSNFL